MDQVFFPVLSSVLPFRKSLENIKSKGLGNAMRKQLLEHLKCPVCQREQFDLSSIRENQVEIRQAIITCRGCQHAFHVENGVLDLLVNPSQEITSEQAGWAQLEKMVVNTDELMLSLPDGIAEHKAAWQSQAENFHYMWSQIQLNGTEKVLDLGAGRCWATRYFARRGCLAVGLDVLLTRYVGLLTSDVYIEKEGVYFERVCSDMNQIPMRDSVFDVVFMAATLHHSSDIQATLKQVHAALKPGGSLVLINEPVVSLFASKNLSCPEVEHGINEHVYRYLEYHRALKGLNFNLQLFPFIGGYATPVRTLNHLMVKTFPKQLMLKRVWPPLLVAQLLLYGGILNLVAQKPDK